MMWRDIRAPISGGGNLREFARFEGTRLKVLEGTGVDEDPFREAVYYFDEHGELIHVKDPVRPNEMAALAEATELSHRYRSDAERLIAAGAGLREVPSGSAPLGGGGGIREWDRAVEEARRPA